MVVGVCTVRLGSGFGAMMLVQCCHGGMHGAWMDPPVERVAQGWKR